LSVCTCSSDAGRTACTRPLWCSGVALGFCNAKAPTKGLSTLNSMAFGLAVDASQCGLLQPHARLASGCWSGSTGRASHPQDSAERFQSCSAHLIPLSQALLGTNKTSSEVLAQSKRPQPGDRNPTTPSCFCHIGRGLLPRSRKWRRSVGPTRAPAGGAIVSCES
jgi:hypothetical protein